MPAPASRSQGCLPTRSKLQRLCPIQQCSKAASSATSCWTRCRFAACAIETDTCTSCSWGCRTARFVDVEAEPRPEVTDHFQALGVVPADGCEAEVCLTAPAWMTHAAKALRRGYVLTLDYGYEAPELYAPWRKRGTLLTFYRHTSGDDPYTRIGRQDITASVDFTSVRRAGEAAGLTTLGSKSQGEFLAALGIGEALASQPDTHQLEAYYALRRAVVELTDPAGLGRITALILGKGVPATLPQGLAGAR